MIPQKPSSAPATLAVHGIVAGEPLTTKTAHPSLVVTLEASTVEASVGRERTVIDRTACLVVPDRTRIRFTGTTPANRVAVIGFGEEVLVAVERTYRKLGLERARLDRWLARPAPLTRTVWVHEIVHRYVFERRVLDVERNLATRFLEIEILKEIYFLFRDREAGAERATASQRYSPIVERAVGFIEAHLFESHGIAELARRAGASESTLLRSFHRELGSKPGEYWRARRLDEALVLVRAGGHSIAEIASKVGYENPTSFGHAFRARFGRPPSAFVRKTPTRPAPGL